MIRRPPRSTQSRSSAASDVYKRQGGQRRAGGLPRAGHAREPDPGGGGVRGAGAGGDLSLIHISEPTRPY